MMNALNARKSTFKEKKVVDERSLMSALIAPKPAFQEKKVVDECSQCP
ncbi:hypothetical protein [Neobacillus massiliamazoniensis]|nr:hypothetical protein [Neobacillus massiliamazoniensis]